MNNVILTKKFFLDNPVKEFSAAQFVYTQLLMPALLDIASDFARSYNKRAEQERERLQYENNPDILIKMLRGRCDKINMYLLHERVLANEMDVIPRVLEMFKTSINDALIENTVKILARTKNNYSKDILEMFHDIASPYALSLICITIGFIADEDVIPVLMDKFEYFKKHYPDNTYEQGPLLGLFQIDQRFKVCK